MRSHLLASTVAIVLSLGSSACSRESTSSSGGAGSAGASANPRALNVGHVGDVGDASDVGSTGNALAIGSPAPDFTAKAHDGFDVQIAALKGKPVVLYFYPKDETPGCTKEACAFRDAWNELSKTGAVLVGISTDDLESHKKFAAHHELPFHLVSDPDGAIAKAYGVPNRGGVLARQSFVIDASGRLKKIYRTVDVKSHAGEILADLKS